MWKFYNNVLFGKSLQDAAKNIDVDIVWNNSRANTKIKSSRFRGRQILDPDTLAISTTPPKISRRMAFAVGFSILEFSKLEMYQVSCTLGWRKKICQVWDSNPLDQLDLIIFSHFFKAWYDKICPTFPGAELCASDTDSFLFRIKSKNLFEDLKKITNFWDFSTLPKNHPYFDDSKQNQLGFFKVETGGDRVYSCAGMFFPFFLIS